MTQIRPHIYEFGSLHVVTLMNRGHSTALRDVNGLDSVQHQLIQFSEEIMRRDGEGQLEPKEKHLPTHEQKRLIRETRPFVRYYGDEYVNVKDEREPRTYKEVKIDTHEDAWIKLCNMRCSQCMIITYTSQRNFRKKRET